MEVEKGRCFNCYNAISEEQGNFCLCEVCQINPLCVQCALVSTLAICRSCDAQQLALANDQAMIVADMPKCPQCNGVWKISKCKVCQRELCARCQEDFSKHTCFKCHHCNGKMVEVCCDRKWCNGCLVSYHHRTNCELTLSYTCRWCTGRVLQFGNERFRCSIPNCHLGWVCRMEPCLRDNTVRNRFYCRDHISRFRCPGCHAHYALDGTQGYVRFLKVVGARVWKREYCGPCREQMRALVQGILIRNKRCRRPLAIPKEIIDMILLRFG